MKKIFPVFIALPFLAFALFPPRAASAAPNIAPANQSASALIAEVNALRASYGLSPYSTNSILMGTAQGHADYMAATGNVSHTGAGGSSVTERLLNAGYPLAGDLAQGGFRSENIQAGTGLTAAQAVSIWTGDAPHLNTMTSPNLTEIGAGVSQAGGLFYYVIDCARPTGSGQQQAFTPSVGGVPGTAPVNQYIVPVTISTPNNNGAVIHEVQSGQSLWAIAIAYGVKIDDIRKWNNISGIDIYTDQKLLVMYAPTFTADPPTAAPTETMIASTSTASPAPSETSTATMAATLTAQPESSASDGEFNYSAILIVALIIIIAAALAVVFARTGGGKLE